MNRIFAKLPTKEEFRSYLILIRHKQWHHPVNWTNCPLALCMFWQRGFPKHTIMFTGAGQFRANPWAWRFVDAFDDEIYERKLMTSWDAVQVLDRVATEEITIRHGGLEFLWTL